jgi:glucokinase
MQTADVLISVDLGGTNIRAARFERQGDDWYMVEQQRTLTEAYRGCESTVERIKNQVRLVWPQDGRPVLGIGISAPGPINPRTGILVAPPNLGNCYQVPLEAELKTAFGVATYLGNDANVAVLAEVALGAAQGYRDAIFMTISTGIGGGVVTDGRLLLGKDGLGRRWRGFDPGKAVGRAVAGAQGESPN